MIIILMILVRKAPYLRKKWMLAPTVPKHCGKLQTLVKTNSLEFAEEILFLNKPKPKEQFLRELWNLWAGWATGEAGGGCSAGGGHPGTRPPVLAQLNFPITQCPHGTATAKPHHKSSIKTIK